MYSTPCFQLANKSSQRELYIFPSIFCLTHTLALPRPASPISSSTTATPLHPNSLLLFHPKTFITFVVSVASVPTTVCSLAACK